MIDLYSDTVTRPTKGMYAAMAVAAVGDDQRGDDPSARALEERVAALLGQPAGLLMPTATMANQVAVAVSCRPGDEVICHRTAHLYNFEAGGLAANSGAQVVPLDGDCGVFAADALRAAIRPQDPHFARSAMVVVENTSNMGGGTVWPDAVFDEVVNTADSAGLHVHIDGARIFNAAVERGVEVAHWSRKVNSVTVCFSKGLGCPFGAVLAGSADFVSRARAVRQRLGGAFRQAGVLAGAMGYALDHHVERLQEDHRRLRHLAEALSQRSPLLLSPHQTNILYFRHPNRPSAAFAKAAYERGVWLSEVSGSVRACTHLNISDADIERACDVIVELANA